LALSLRPIINFTQFFVGFSVRLIYLNPLVADGIVLTHSWRTHVVRKSFVGIANLLASSSYMVYIWALGIYLFIHAL